jgi:hypothetical protein
MNIIDKEREELFSPLNWDRWFLGDFLVVFVVVMMQQRLFNSALATSCYKGSKGEGFIALNILQLY